MNPKETVPNKKKICLLSDLHICINPRVWKEAFFYEKQGYEVVVLTMWQSKELLEKDFELLAGHHIQYKQFLNLIPGEINLVARFFYRLRRRLAGDLQRFFKIGTAWAICHAPGKLVTRAIEEDADIYAAHVETGFLAGRDLVKAGKKVCFDFEDWYSHDYLGPTRATVLLAKLEKYALLNGIFCTAASESMAEALIDTYTGSQKITSIYNSFPENELQGIPNVAENGESKIFQLIWTSRTIGAGRGLETLLEALRNLKIPVELNLIGKCAPGYKDFLTENWPAENGHRLVFHDFIRHSELLKQIATFDLGIAIEEYEPESRNKTITNKILQYLQAGIRVLATETDGQKEVAQYFPESVFLVPGGDTIKWREQLEAIITLGKGTNKKEYFKQFEPVFSWRIQEEKLKQLIAEAI